jgi:protein-disulfide isomerase
VLIGNPTAPIKLVEFADFECPYCRRADSTYRKVAARFGPRLAMVFIHDPLKIHRFAMPAAQAAECAAEQGRFDAYHDQLYDKQDSLGLKSWLSLAVAAGVRDSAGFQDCINRGRGAARIQRGLAAAKQFGVNATPTILINGWRFWSPPTESQLDSTIDALLIREGAR